MVLPSNVVPPNAGWVARETQSLRGALREGLASVAASLRGPVSDLADQVAFLQGQTGSDFRSAGYVSGSTTGAGLFAYDPDIDAHLDVQTSSTGVLDIHFGAFVCILTSGEASAGLVVEILSAGSVVETLTPAGLYQGAGASLGADVSGRRTVPLAPVTLYTLRVRREYAADSGARVFSYGATWLTSTKLGM